MRMKVTAFLHRCLMPDWNCNHPVCLHHLSYNGFGRPTEMTSTWNDLNQKIKKSCCYFYFTFNNNKKKLISEKLQFSIFVSLPTIYDCLERLTAFIFWKMGTLKVKPLMIIGAKGRLRHMIIQSSELLNILLFESMDFVDDVEYNRSSMTFKSCYS